MTSAARAEQLDQADDRGQEALLAWRVHPASGRPLAVAATLLYVVLVTAGLQLWLGRAWLSGLGCAILLGAAAEFLFPSTYLLTTAGAVRRSLAGTRRVDWPAVRRVYRLESGLKLSTLAGPGPLEPYRGLFLPWADRQEIVTELVDQLAAARLRPEEASR